MRCLLSGCNLASAQNRTLNLFFDHCMREPAVALELEHHVPEQAEDFKFRDARRSQGLVLPFDCYSCRIANATAGNRTRSSHSICVLKHYLPSLMHCSFSDAAAVVLLRLIGG
jgi:hypothetical protein